MSKIKKKQVFCLSGWAQKHDSLDILFSQDRDQFEIIHFDYSKIENIENFFDKISGLNINPEVIVGWSLGGQLSCRIVDRKVLKPKYLILISTPFQFVKSSRISVAMSQKSFRKFYDDFVSIPKKTLNKFSILMNINDKDAQILENNLEINDNNHRQLIYWLNELEKFSCYDINFNDFPETLVIHGLSDLIVNFNQGKKFQKTIKKSYLEIIYNCGHIPHIKHFSYLNKKILEFSKGTL